MKLLVISMLYEPDFVGIAAIASDMCAELARRGHEVTVYTTYPYYPEWQRKSDANPWRIQEEVSGNITVRRHGLYIPSKPSHLVPRIAHELSFPLSLSRSLFSRRQFDMVMVFCPLLGSVAFAALRKVFQREPLWLNVQDLPAEAGRATGINGSKLFHFLGSTVQRALFSLRRRVEQHFAGDGGTVGQVQAGQDNATPLSQLADRLSGRTCRSIAQQGRPPARQPLELLYCGTIGKKRACYNSAVRCMPGILSSTFKSVVMAVKPKAFAIGRETSTTHASK